MQQLIHVKIGLTDGVYPVRKFYTEGVFKDIYEFQENANTIAWVHKRWCTPVSAPQVTSDSVPCHGLQAVDSVTTDWRSFLKTYWDAEHNHCKVEYLNDFMVIFNRAAANYMRRKSTTHVEYTAAPQQPVKQKTAAPAKPKKPHYVQLSLFD